MNCQHCGFPHNRQFSVCPVCGEPIPPSPLALTAPKKTSARLPYMFIAVMLLIGLTLFFLIPMDTPKSPAVQEHPPTATDSVPETTLPAETKNLFQKDCFLLADGQLSFDESKFIANPILIVPSAIDEQPVKVISPRCFEGLEGVTTIILPSSIIRIGDFAFAGCTDLRGVCIPNAVEVIGMDAFRGCKNLEAVYIPTGLSGIGSGAFEDCPKLSFVFYNGFYEQWQSLYPEIITPFTWVISWDGEYRHRGKT